MKDKLLNLMTKAPAKVVRWVALISGVAFWPLGVVVALTHGTAKIACGILAACCFIANWGAGRVETSKAESKAREAEEEAAREATRARHREADLNVTIQEILVPFVHQLEAAIGKPAHEKADNVGAAKQIILAGLSRVLEGESKGCLRACLFRLHLGPPRELRCDKFTGRATAPRHRFVEGTEEGEYVLSRLDKEERYFVTKETPSAPAWLFSNRDYQEFISVPVSTRSATLGMLTVDSTEPDVLTQDDVKFVRAMAGLLAVALSQ